MIVLAGAGPVDWDHPDSWLPGDALAALERLCREGTVEVIVAQDVVAPCRDAGPLAAAYCVRQHPLVTFWRRRTRDLREHRKPPLLVLRSRGTRRLEGAQCLVHNDVGR